MQLIFCRSGILPRLPLRSMLVAVAAASRSYIAALVLVGAPAFGGVLPEDRADVLYHTYSGGGMTIEGPSILVRKQFAGKFSASANYYVDKITSASVDVVTTASPYTEERRQHSVGLDYLHDRWLMNIGITSSEENDYSAETFSFGISQDFFGDLTTVSLGYSLGQDDVRRRGDSTFGDQLERQSYRLGLTQILTRRLLVGLNYEAITDEGFLNNPYRLVRFVDSSSPRGYSYEQELYPRTRTSDAAALRLRYYLPYRAALHGEYRSYSDSWSMTADHIELGYTHPLERGWTVEGKLRFYSQNQADFYSDLYPRAQAQNFLARDKELSTFTSQTLRLSASYDIMRGGRGFVERGSVNVVYDHIVFDYENFRDLTVTGGVAGDEPLFRFGANVFQVFLSFWF